MVVNQFGVFKYGHQNHQHQGAAPSIQRVVQESFTFVFNHYTAAKSPENVETHHVEPEEGNQYEEVQQISLGFTWDGVTTEMHYEQDDVSIG